MKKLISALKKVIAFKSDSLSILKSMIDGHVGSYDYLMSSAGDDEWEFYQSEGGELSRDEWANEEDVFNSQEGNPAHFFYNTKELKSSWLVHFTDANPLNILKSGFKGRDYFGLGLTTHFKPDANPGDLAFAYPINKIKEMFRYGNNAVVLKVPECLQAYHIGDEEDQIIFDVNKVTKMFGLVYKKGTDEYAVINKNGKEVKRFLATKDNLKKLAVGCTKKNNFIAASESNTSKYEEVLNYAKTPQDRICIEIANNDELWEHIALYVSGDPNALTDNPMLTKKLEEQLKKVTPFKPRFQYFYRGESLGRGKNSYIRSVESWTPNKEVALYFAKNNYGPVVQRTSGPVQGIELANLCYWRTHLREGESHYSGSQAEWLLLRPKRIDTVYTEDTGWVKDTPPEHKYP